MAISFKYKVLPDEVSNDTKKPVIKVELSGNGATHIDVIGLLDSGADVSVIPRGLSDFLNLDLGEEENSKGIGGEISIRNSFFNMKIKGGHETYSFSRVPVQVAKDNNIPIIFGRAGFFKKFQITIDEDKKRVKLKRNS